MNSGIMLVVERPMSIPAQVVNRRLMYRLRRVSVRCYFLIYYLNSTHENRHYRKRSVAGALDFAFGYVTPKEFEEPLYK